MSVRDAYLQEMYACEMRMTSFQPFRQYSRAAPAR